MPCLTHGQTHDSHKTWCNCMQPHSGTVVLQWKQRIVLGGSKGDFSEPAFCSPLNWKCIKCWNINSNSLNWADCFYEILINASSCQKLSRIAENPNVKVQCASNKNFLNAGSCLKHSSSMGEGERQHLISTGLLQTLGWLMIWNPAWRGREEIYVVHV